MERHIIEKFNDNIAFLIQKTIDKKIVWKKSTPSSFYWDNGQQSENIARISIQRTNSHIHPVFLDENIASLKKTILHDYNYVFQISDLRTNDIVIKFSTDELITKLKNTPELRYLIEILPSLYREIDLSFNRIGADFFDLIMPK